MPLLKQIIKTLLKFFLAPYFLILRYRLLQDYKNKIEKLGSDKQLFFLAQDQFGSIIYHVAYFLYWKKFRGNALLVMFSPSFNDIVKLTKLFDTDLQSSLLYPNFNFLNKNLLSYNKLNSIVKDAVFIPVFKELSFLFPNHIYLFGANPNNVAKYFPELDPILNTKFPSLKIKNAYRRGRYSIDTYQDFKLDFHQLFYQNKGIKLNYENKSRFIKKLNLPQNYIVVNINTKFDSKNKAKSTNDRAVQSSKIVKKIIEYLIQKGHFVVLHGRNEQPKFTFRENFFDYAHSNLLSIENDVLLIYYANAFFTTKSGPENIPLLTNTPTFGFNYTDFSSMSPLRKLRFVPKKFEYKNKEIGWKKYLQFESYYERNMSKIVSQNIKYKENSFEELLPSIDEFLSLLEKNEESWDRLSILQKSFKKNVYPYHLDLYNIKGVPTNYYLKNKR